MAMQGYSTQVSRNLIRAEGAMLKYAQEEMVLTMFGAQKDQPLRKTDTIVFRRVKPVNAGANEVANIDPAAFATSEGTTPNAMGISYTDVSVQVKQWAVLFKFTSKAELMYEDDIPGDMKKLTGDTIGILAELVAYGQMKAGTSVVYSNSTTRAGVNTKIGANVLRRAARTLETNRGRMVTKKQSADEKFGSVGVEPGYVVFISSDSKADVRDLPNFKSIVDYGSAISPLHKKEIGSYEDFRFIVQPLLTPFLAQGSATLNGMLSAAGARVDVYPSLVIAEDAIGHVSLKGHGFTSISPTIISSKTKTHYNPGGMFGFVGADFWFNSVRLNENWLCRVEHGNSSLS